MCQKIRFIPKQTCPFYPPPPKRIVLRRKKKRNAECSDAKRKTVEYRQITTSCCVCDDSDTAQIYLTNEQALSCRCTVQPSQKTLIPDEKIFWFLATFPYQLLVSTLVRCERLSEMHKLDLVGGNCCQKFQIAPLSRI